MTTRATEINLVILGFGSIAKATMPFFSLTPGIFEAITVIAPDIDQKDRLTFPHVNFVDASLLEINYRKILDSTCNEGDFLLNLSVGVATKDLITYCLSRSILYLDTCIEPWAGVYTDSSIPVADRSNYSLREEVLGLKKDSNGKSTCLIAHGANPGLVSHFLKKALSELKSGEEGSADPTTPEQWASLSKSLNIKTIHIAERDTQVSRISKQDDEFVNTWSVDGLISEATQPAELGWGTHEHKESSLIQYHKHGCDAAVYINQPGALTRVKTWTPLGGACTGFLVTHNEAISIADYLTERIDGAVSYRPTVHYAYHPCNDAILSLHEYIGRGWKEQKNKRILRDEIIDGSDALGVLLLGQEGRSYWYGSILSVSEARELMPFNSATSLQVAAGVYSGVIWCLENRFAGVVEPEDIDHKRILEIALPYLGRLEMFETAWMPDNGVDELFDRSGLPTDAQWQIENFIV